MPPPTNSCVEGIVLLLSFLSSFFNHVILEVSSPNIFWGKNLKFAKNSVLIRLYLRGLWGTTQVLYMVYGVVSQNRLKFLGDTPLDHFRSPNVNISFVTSRLFR